MRRRNVLADEVGLERQLAKSAIYKYRQLYRARSSLAEQTIDCGSDGSSGIDNVINEDNVTIVYVKRNIGRINDRLNILRSEIVAIVGDVDMTYRHARALDLKYLLCNAVGQARAALENAYYNDTVDAFVSLGYLMRQTPDSTGNPFSVHYTRL